MVKPEGGGSAVLHAINSSGTERFTVVPAKFQQHCDRFCEALKPQVLFVGCNLRRGDLKAALLSSRTPARDVIQPKTPQTVQRADKELIREQNKRLASANLPDGCYFTGDEYVSLAGYRSRSVSCVQTHFSPFFLMHSLFSLQIPPRHAPHGR